MQTTADDQALVGRWRLHPRVALRPEPFGALAYHYDNRRLNFLRSPDLVALVEVLESHQSPRMAFDAQGIDARRWPAFQRALTALAASDFLQPVDGRAAQPQATPNSSPDEAGIAT
ncbi:MAG: mycofactocin biosynthesis chaperone MftB [Actinomycetota bacterium]